VAGVKNRLPPIVKASLTDCRHQFPGHARCRSSLRLSTDAGRPTPTTEAHVRVVPAAGGTPRCRRQCTTCGPSTLKVCQDFYELTGQRLVPVLREQREGWCTLSERPWFVTWHLSLPLPGLLHSLPTLMHPSGATPSPPELSVSEAYCSHHKCMPGAMLVLGKSQQVNFIALCCARVRA
jgi:hypothetical protein